MVEFVVVERQNPLLGLTHGVFRKGEAGSVPICLCYGETQANLVAAALAAYVPPAVAQTPRLPAPLEQPSSQAPKPPAKKAPQAKAQKPPPRRQRRKPA
ncbi:MAG: hypothetical protein LC737_05535 [Chloroflexi bacterium]|nr:hypothetical protein [Chloroflexota bacterium]